jgi:hypothetical protein
MRVYDRFRAAARARRGGVARRRLGRQRGVVLVADGVPDVEGERVDEEQPHGLERDRAPEPLADAHGCFDNVGVAEAAGQHEQLEVEGEAALA